MGLPAGTKQGRSIYRPACRYVLPCWLLPRRLAAACVLAGWTILQRPEFLTVAASLPRHLLPLVCRQAALQRPRTAALPALCRIALSSPVCGPLTCLPACRRQTLPAHPPAAPAGLSLYSAGWPTVGQCVQLGMPVMALIILFAFHMRRVRIFGCGTASWPAASCSLPRGGCLHASRLAGQRPVAPMRGIRTRTGHVRSAPRLCAIAGCICSPGAASRGWPLFVTCTPAAPLASLTPACPCRWPVFGLFPVLLGLGLSWLYAYIFTVAGVYDNASADTQVRPALPASPRLRQHSCGCFPGCRRAHAPAAGSTTASFPYRACLQHAVAASGELSLPLGMSAAEGVHHITVQLRQHHLGGPLDPLPLPRAGTPRPPLCPMFCSPWMARPAAWKHARQDAWGSMRLHLLKYLWTWHVPGPLSPYAAAALCKSIPHRT